jgi:hypothetical protein
MSIEFKNQIVRDLEWVISSPPFFDNLFLYPSVQFLTHDFFNSEVEQFKSQLYLLDKNPESLADHILFGNNKLLGKYFESLVEFWLLYSKRFEILSKGIQVDVNGETLGEFDFILRDRLLNKFIHLEAAGKYYLSFNNSESWESFIGPNPNDNLQRKMRKLLNDQINLGKTDSGKIKLAELGITELETAIMIKGYFFYHLKYFLSDSFCIPEFSFPNHQKGWWLRFGEAENLKHIKTERWIVLKRQNWISKAVTEISTELFDLNTLLSFLKNYFEFNHYPLLIASMELQDNYFVESTRGFVVSDLWPDLNFIH